jgi:hypothetical protein
MKKKIFLLGFVSIFQLICFIIYMIIIGYFMWIEIRLLFTLKWKYFKQFWSIIEISIIVCSWSSIGIYIWRYKECQRIGNLLKQTNGYVYINLQLISYVNNILIYLFGFCCFFGTIKLFRVFRFNRRVCLFVETLEYAGKELFSFLMMFSIVFVAFLILFYLLFISYIWSCSSLFQTSQMLFQMTVMKYNVKQLIEAAPVLGPFCFSLFIFVVVFICMNMFITIINGSFRHVRENVNNNDHQEIFSFMLKTFLRWTSSIKNQFLN